MVSWASNGTMSGVVRKNLHSGSGGPLADACTYDGIAAFYTVPGTTDAQITTRIQYDIPYGTIDPSWQISTGLTVSGTFTFTSGDFPGDGVLAGVALFVVNSLLFDDGVVPTPSELLSRGDDGVAVYRAEGGISSPAASVGFSSYVPPGDLDPNTKYWALFAPINFFDGDPEDLEHSTPIGNINSNGRALSFWTNRTPGAPVITSPRSGTVVTAGSDVLFAFRPNDPDNLPDAPGDYRSWSFADMAGLQVQYAPRPTHAVPDPDWTDLTIASNQPGVDPTEGRGWYLDYAHSGDQYDGAKHLRDTRTMQIRCGGTLLALGHGILSSGDWQIRMRTFDYGHVLSTVRHTNDAMPGYGPTGTQGSDSPDFSGDGPFPDPSLTPDSMPEENTSPWSSVVNLSVSTEVPAPIPISPINHNAIPEGNEVVLRWQYRNTFVPPKPQEAREVQIRAVGDPDWTTLVSGNSADHFYNVTTMLPDNGPDVDPPPSANEYLSDVGFEAGTLDDWETNSPGTLGISSSGAHSGTKSLEMTAAPSSGSIEHPFRQRVTLRDEDKFFSVKGWALKGGNTTAQSLLIWFLNAELTSILYTTGFIPFETGSGWKYQEVLDLPRPIGAAYMWVMINSTAPSNTNINDKIDDWNILGRDAAPVELTPPPSLDLPVQAPVAYALPATTEYEWRVRVADSGHVTSDWSSVAQFWIVPPPGSGPVIPVPGSTIDGATLGCGTHRVMVFRRGGKRFVGELTQLSYVDWSRLRDDISTAKVVVSGWDVDCGNLLSKLQSWAYELVIYRSNGYSTDRVWEGPITLPTYESDKVTLEAKDVNVYWYRRIIKQAMNDSGDAGGDTVVNRALRILQNVFAPDDPNLLQYLQALPHDDDAREYRNLPEWSRTAYEEIDDMAANSGLDYTAVGRAILLWGTKNRIGTLPELRDKNLGSKPIVSEYGMSMSNVYSVSDGSGAHGEAYRLLLPPEEQTSDEIYGPDGEDLDYGLVEMLSSSWASDSEPDSGTYTQEGLATVEESYAGYAEKSIADRYPPPVVVRVPDNTTLNPNTPISIQHLIPGVVIPLRSESTLRVVKANQKLDSVKVVETSGNETISITLSPFNHDDLADGGGDI